MVLIAGFHKWCEHIFGDDCLQNPAALMRMSSQNCTTTLILEFMYYDGMPYAAWRRMHRQSSTPERRELLDDFYKYYCQRFRSVNKFLYAMLCYHYLFIKENINAQLWDVWASIYGALHVRRTSTIGIPGHETPRDGLMEKVNKYAKQLLGRVITPERVASVVPLLNVLLRLRERFALVWGRPGRQHVHLGAPTFGVHLCPFGDHDAGACQFRHCTYQYAIIMQMTS